MYIICPKCDTKFAVAAEQLGEGGKKVKCSRCSHIWHQTKDNNAKIEPIFNPKVSIPAKNSFENGVNLPALLPLRPPFYLYVTPLILAGMIIFITLTLFSCDLERKLGFDNNKIIIRDVSIDNQKDLEKITVSYKVLNSSNEKVKMPLIRIKLLDKNNRLIQSRIIDNSKIELMPSQDVIIKTDFPAGAEIGSVDIMPGNKLDFILR